MNERYILGLVCILLAVLFDAKTAAIAALVLLGMKLLGMF